MSEVHLEDRPDLAALFSVDFAVRFLACLHAGMNLYQASKALAVPDQLLREFNQAFRNGFLEFVDGQYPKRIRAEAERLIVKNPAMIGT